jgi:hypothetical protein
MTDLELRRDGIYTCLDCKKLQSESCIVCKNWDLFDLIEEKMSYEEKNLRYCGGVAELG